jgi:isopenicillin N synthase-like dioxygenase
MVGGDYGCVTLLLADSTRGALQVLSKSGEWIDADPIEGAFVVNIGDMMERWTNGLWKSTLHRVIHKGSNYRVSVPFFFEPNYDAIIKPLRRCIELTGGQAQYDEVKYGDHLVGKIRGNFY